jgi:ketosteroid isomerase-like protein
MTRILRALTVVTALAAAGCTSATPARDVAADKAKLEADATSWFGFYAKADGDGMANLYAEDALLMPPGAPAAKGRAAIKTFLGDDAAKTKSAGLSIKNGTASVDVSGDMGWVSGDYTVIDGAGMAVDSGHYLSVHELTNGQWLYVRDIWNSDRPAAK